MAEGSIKEDILSKAIHMEIQARNFYREVSEKIKNKKGRTQMLNLSDGEQEHRDILCERFKALFGRNFAQDPDYPQDARLAASKSAVHDQASALEVVSIGIATEKISIDLYRGLIDEVSEAEDIKLLKKLVKFEEKHKQRLQKIYGRLQKHNYWQDK